VSPVRYELRMFIPEDGTLHSHRRESLKCYIFSTVSKLTYDYYNASIVSVVHV
jgi:hypothetical protein